MRSILVLTALLATTAAVFCAGAVCLSFSTVVRADSTVLTAPIVLRQDGAVLVIATTGERSAQNPALSPDGQTLFFTRYLLGYDATLGPGGGLLKRPTTGGTISPLYDHDEATNVNGLASWNGPTNRIAFAVSSGNGDIATVDPQGDEFVRVTNAGPNDTYLEPTYSRDGKFLVFEDDEPGASDQNNRASILRVPAGGGSIKVLVNGRLTATDNRLPVWAPDGSKILFQRRVDLTSDVYNLYTIRPDGSGLQQITHGANCDSDASWSADGKWIADSACFSGFGPTPHSNIFIVSSDGTRVMRATCDVDHEDGAPTISQDGRWIYFESHRTSDDGSPTQIWRINFPSRSVSCP
jgi:TolB protein